MVNHGSHRFRTSLLASLVVTSLALSVEVTAGAAQVSDASPAGAIQPLPTRAPAAPGTPTVTRVALGRTLRLRADGTTLAVTVLGVSTRLAGGRGDVALNGWRYVGVLVEARDVGAGAYSSSDWADVSLYASDGTPGWHVVLGNPTCADRGQPNALAPGDSRRWCVPFELPAHLRPAEVTFAPDGGFGLDIGEWTATAVHQGGI
jgi:hypothetical protein